MSLQRNARIWVHRDQWLPAIVLAVREPGVYPSEKGVGVEEVCAGAVLVSYPEDNKSREWLPLDTRMEPADPRIWDIWDAANCGPAGSMPLYSVNAQQAMKLSVHGIDGEHPIFLRRGVFTKVEPVDARFSYNLCTVRES
jgi:hypothetical protein